MNHFTIKDIENLSGIKAHTLRIWEKRYGIITPKRRESKHRFYDNEDLKNILRITHLYHNGYKISAIANMQKNDVDLHSVNNNSEFGFIKTLLEATLDLNESLFVETFEKATNRFGLLQCIVKVVYPYFEKIGLLWLNNESLPAHERFASNLIIRKIVNEIDKLEITSHHDNISPIVLFTPLKEYHEIPLLFMHYLLKKNGQHVYYLGTNVSFDMLRSFLNINKASTLYFHLITNLTHEKIDNYLQELTQQFKAYKIIMSGKLTERITVKKGNLQLLCSLEEMIAFGNKTAP